MCASVVGAALGAGKHRLLFVPSKALAKVHQIADSASPLGDTLSTKKPRITITLEPRAYEIITRLSAAGGSSMSEIVSGFIEVALGPMERMVVLMEQANDAPEEARVAVAAAVAQAERELLPGMTAMVAQNDMFLGALESAVGVSDAGLAPAPSGAALPHTAAPARASRKRSTPGSVIRGLGHPVPPMKTGKRG